MRRFLKYAIMCLAGLTCPVIGAYADTDDSHMIPSEYKVTSSRWGHRICWGYRYDSSFSEGFELQCICNNEDNTFRVELVVENQDRPYVLPVDEDLAYTVFLLFESVVYSATWLPDADDIAARIDTLKQSSNPSFASLQGIDSEHHYFYNGFHAVECRSPREGNNARMIEVCKLLYNAVAHKDAGIIRNKLVMVTELTDSYLKQIPEPFREYFFLLRKNRPKTWWRFVD